jgi:tetratricopeptide (TPR) repeat protein
MAHVIEYALRGLEVRELALLRAIAGFRMPAAYETLAALLVKIDGQALFSDHNTFNQCLEELDERGLVGWDRRANRYDLHPIVRSVVWSHATAADRRTIADAMRVHFESMPVVAWETIDRFDQLTPAIELYVSLIRLGRFEEALDIFRSRLSMPTLYRLSASRERVALVEMLFPDGAESPPALKSPQSESYALNAIAQGYLFSGQPGRAAQGMRRATALDEGDDDPFVLGVGLCNLSDTLRRTGELHEAERSVVRALKLGRADPDTALELVSLRLMGVLWSTRSRSGCIAVFRRALTLSESRDDYHNASVASFASGVASLWKGEPNEALVFARQAWELAARERHERDFIRAARLHGEALLVLGDVDSAEERLHYALTRARWVDLVEEEVPILSALAELSVTRKEFTDARGHLDAIWQAAEDGPYPLLHADARNVLAKVEIAEGKTAAAIDAASLAYRLAWCDGPPFAYDFGLRTARAHLQALSAPRPEMPPYDPSKREPIEEISIDQIDADSHASPE